jgi:hypothetical protein
MAKTYSLDEIFGSGSTDEETPSAPSIKEVDAEADRTYSLDEVFATPQGPPTPNAQPQSRGRNVPGVPYPVAPMDALGLPEDLEVPSDTTQFAERFTRNLPDVTMDVVDATKGVIRDTLWADMTTSEKTAGKQLFDDLRKVQATRAPLQGAMQFSKTVQNVINHPLALAGMEGADDNAYQADRIVTALGQENSRRAAEGLIAQAFGETAGGISETVISSLVEQYLGARLLGGAGKGATAMDKAKRATRSAMAYTALSAGGHALTEAKDELGLEGAKQWGYAGSVGAINAAFIAGGGALARKLGIEDAAQAMFSDTAPVIANVLSKAGVKEALATILKGTKGALLEGGEEAGTEFTAGLTKAAFDGDPEGALDRMIAKTNDEKFRREVVTAGLTGVAARGAIGAVKNLGKALEKAKNELPGSIDRIVEGVQTRRDRERLAATEQVQTGEVQAETPPAAPPEAQVAPDQVQTPATPPAEGAPAAAPQGAPLAPAPEAAAAAPPSVEPVAGAPPAGPPATPPGEAADEPAPPRTAPPEPPPEGVSPKNAAMASQAKRMTGRDIPYSANKVEWNDSIDTAIQLGVPARAMQLANTVITSPRVLTDVETAGLAVRLVDIDSRYRAAIAKVNQAPEAQLTGEALDAAAVANDLETEFFTIREALLKAGTETGRALAARKMRLGEDYGLLPTLNRMFAAKKEKLSDFEKKGMTRLVETENEVSTKLAEVDQKVKDEVAEKALNQPPSEPNVGDPGPLLSRLDQLLQLGCDLA